MPDSRICSIPGCGNVAKGRGWCDRHRGRFYRTGHPLLLKKHSTPRKETLDFIENVVFKYDGDTCLEWPYAHIRGRAITSWNGRQNVPVARLACEIENGPPPSPAHEARHLCGKGHLKCVTRKHLAWGTAKENGQDKILHGTSGRGEKNNKAKLTEAQVREIRGLKGSASQNQIARQFGVTKPLIRMIHQRKVWGWLE